MYLVYFFTRFNQEAIKLRIVNYSAQEALFAEELIMVCSNTRVKGGIHRSFTSAILVI